jgi:polar amino acid transport system substrate-binding protein
MCVAKDWMPYEDFADGKHKGMLADYMRLLQKKIEIPFKAIPTNSVTQAREFVKSGKCEIVSNIIPTVWGGRYHGYSFPYLSIPLSIASRSGMKAEHAIPNSIAVIKETAFEEIIRVRYPGIKVIQVDSGMQGLSLVQDGNVEGMLCTGAHISSMISEHNIKDVVVDDFANEEVGISVAVAKDNDLLLGLIDKAIRSITHEERQDITNRWINVKPKPTIDPDLLWKVLIGFGVIILLGVYANWLIVRHNKQLSKIAGTDWLTQLPNRHSLIRKMEGFINHSNRYSRTVSLIYFDIDNFKIVNDRFGHHIGDKVLKKLAELLIKETRKTDVCGRWGGEEFILASLEADIDESVIIAEKLRKKIEAHDFKLPIKITCSFGVAQYEGDEPLEHLVHRADLALYEAKNSGRNRVIAYESGSGE